MFYLNRGGAPEGPFDEARIVQMIRSGELTQGGVCPVGQNQWWPLQQIPAFAQALAQRAAPAPAPTPGYGPPQAGGYLLFLVFPRDVIASAGVLFDELLVQETLQGRIHPTRILFIDDASGRVPRDFAFGASAFRTALEKIHKK